MTEQNGSIIGIEPRLAEQNRSVSLTELSLVKQNRSMSGTQSSLSEHNRSISLTELSLAEQSRSIIRTQPSLVKQSRSIIRTSPALTEQNRISSQTQLSLAEQNESIIGIQPSLAEQNTSITHAKLPLAECVIGTLPSLAGPRRSIIRTEQPLAEQEKSTGIEQSLAEQNRSITEMEYPLADGEKSTGAEQPLAEQHRPTKGTEVPLAGQEESTRTGWSLAEQSRSMNRTDLPLAEGLRPPTELEALMAGKGQSAKPITEGATAQVLPAEPGSSKVGTMEKPAERGGIEPSFGGQAGSPSQSEAPLAEPQFDPSVDSTICMKLVEHSTALPAGVQTVLEQAPRRTATPEKGDTGGLSFDSCGQQSAVSSQMTGESAATTLDPCLSLGYPEHSGIRARSPDIPGLAVDSATAERAGCSKVGQEGEVGSGCHKVIWKIENVRELTQEGSSEACTAHILPEVQKDPEDSKGVPPSGTSLLQPAKASFPQLADPPCLQPTDPPSSQPTNSPSPQLANPPSSQPTDPLSPQPANPPSPQPTDPLSPQPAAPPAPQPANPSSPQLADPPSPEPTDPRLPQLVDPPSPQSSDPPSLQPVDRPSPQPANPPSLPPTNSPSHLLSDHSSPHFAASGHREPCAKGQQEQGDQDQAIGCYPANLLTLDLNILHSGALTLPGNRDRNGRALVVVTTKNTIWEDPKCSSTEFAKILIYYYNISKKEVQNLGLRFLIDARDCRPTAALYGAFRIFQKTIQGGMHSVLMLTRKESSVSVEGLAGIQVDILMSIRSLHKHVDPAQLTQCFSGSFPYSNEKWIRYRLRLESLLHACRASVDFLRSRSDQLEAKQLPESAEDIPFLIEEDKMLMRQVLQDARLIGLQQEGAAILVKLRRETVTISGSEDCTPDLELTCALYNKVDEEVHHLVQVSNQRQRDLEHLAEFWQFEAQFQKVSNWIRNMGQPQLNEYAKLADSLPVLRKKQQEFRIFNQMTLEHCQKAQGLLRDMAHWESAISPQLGTFAKRLQDSRRQLSDFTQEAERCRLCIDRAIRLYEFFKMAYSWALGTIRILAGISMDHCLSPQHCDTALASLRRLAHRHPEIPDSRFQEMQRLAEELGDPRCLQQWASCRAKCRESQAEAARKLEAALGTCSAAQGPRQPSPGSLCQRRGPEGAAAVGQRGPGRRSPWPPGAASLSPSLSAVSLVDDGSCCSGLLDGLEWTGSALSALSLASSSEGGDPDGWADLPGRCSNLSFSSVYASTPDVRGSDLPPLLRLLQRPPGSPRVGRRAKGGFPSPLQDHPPLQETLHGGLSQRSLSETGSDASGMSTGVLIRGLEVSSTEVVDRTCSPKEHVMLARAGIPLPDAPWGGMPRMGPQVTGSKPRHSLAEALAAEQEYVSSLAHVVENYFPEMDRPDVPQGLRGKRGVVFGNLEKLLAFHRRCLLPELRGCLAHPLRLGECFLRHKEHFSMYSLYVKNKPQSDALLTSHGNAFFERRQRFLGDKTDLASYLQKPIERIRSYNLLLGELSAECEASDARELLCLRAAKEMVQYQLRHGYNLLAMESIRGCDVNLKEQGQLLRHDSFIVSCGRRKSTRHVFLFEQLIVFTKLKRADGVSETYIYKTSLKTADAGLTESIGDSGLRFEVWFRRRRRSNEAYVFQAESPDVKQAWTGDIAQILWRQASRNKELRLQEMVTMGMGSKLFLDVPCPTSVVDPPAGGKEGATRRQTD